MNEAISKLETLIGRRFCTLKVLETEIRKMGYPDAILSVDECVIEGHDFELIGTLQPNDEDGYYYDFTLFHLRDRMNQYYITELNPWGL